MAAVQLDTTCLFIKDWFLGGEDIRSGRGGCRDVACHGSVKTRTFLRASVWLLARSTLYMLLRLFCYEVLVDI